MPVRLRRSSSLAVLCAALLAGCSGETHTLPELYPVQGTVVKGKRPVNAGFLQLLDPSLQENMLVANGAVRDDGTFELSTLSTKVKDLKKPGAPAGKYRIL